MLLLNHFTLLPIRRGGKGRWAHTPAQHQKSEKKRKEEEKGKTSTNRCAGVAPARVCIADVFSHGVAPRRQASSVARRAPSHSHVTLHWAARSNAVRVVARYCSKNSSINFLLFVLRKTSKIARKNFNYFCDKPFEGAERTGFCDHTNENQNVLETIFIDKQFRQSDESWDFSTSNFCE